ncbi:hypothetical protein PX699_10420 [Sphingobium sp. H39-3-25]|uniref:hypothetical protein n=1 Tax=Sphingobium arseniciresistens TaxID=3030834 RepID=UPI0023B9EE12|nr:hypothetical protein [Sphingobium arseniciresistens]
MASNLIGEIGTMKNGAIRVVKRHELVTAPYLIHTVHLRLVASNLAVPFSVFATLRRNEQPVAFLHSNVLLICLASAAGGRLARICEAIHERHPDPDRSIVTWRAHAAHRARTGNRGLA